MKAKYPVFIICILTVVNIGLSQNKTGNSNQVDNPVINSHDPDYENMHKGPAVSFYKQKENWQEIIDNYWGPGQPLNTKLDIFDTYATYLTEWFYGFNKLGITVEEWNSIKSSYRAKINEQTSRGTFAAIMSRFAYNLHDMHNYAIDSVIYTTPLSQGTPVLIIGSIFGAEHFGAVVTATEDDEIIVLRTIESHPLALQQGDIILGYENIPWETLVAELLDSDIPLIALCSGVPSSMNHNEMISATFNWHLFDTIDIVKYSSGDTIHLPVEPLSELPDSISLTPGGITNQLMNNEQLPIPGITFPSTEDFYDNPVISGIIEGTNLGYMYSLHLGSSGTDPRPDQQLYEAASSFLNTDGIIIDMRINFGGSRQYAQMLSLLFNQEQYTFDDAQRCSPSNFSLCPRNRTDKYIIPGDQQSLYDRPIAILLGPSCISAGEVLAYLLKEHPMSRTFGLSVRGGMSCSYFINFNEWQIRSADCDMFYLSNPEEYIMSREFPIDNYVWFSKDNAANGIDPVVEKAIEWIQGLSHAHDVNYEIHTSDIDDDTLSITAEVENPNNHTLVVSAEILNNSEEVIDTVEFYDDGNHEDGNLNDGVWGATWVLPEETADYLVNVTTEDTEAGTIRTLPHVIQFSIVGIADIMEPFIRIYPNPTNSFLTIETDKLGHHFIEITSLSGQLLYRGDMEKNIIDMTPYPEGIYFVTVKSEAFVRTDKVVKY